MSVIGRLDDQVEAILINPAGRRGRAGEATPADQDAAADRPAPRETDATDADEGDRPRPAREDEDAPRPDALPVWLL